MIAKEQNLKVLPKIREITIGDYRPDKVIQNLAAAGVVFDTRNEAYRCFLRTRDNKPLVPDYPDSVLAKVVENIGQFGCEYNPIGQSIGTLKQPLMTYAVPHPNFGENSNQVGFIIVYDTKKAPELFSSYSTPTIDSQNIDRLKGSVKAIYRINYS